MQSFRARAWLFATVAAVASGTNGAALAQEQASGTEEVIVTAQRRETNLQQTPIAVTALSEETLNRANISSTQDLMQVVPSLQVATQSGSAAGGSATFFLRGMGQQTAGNGSGPAVGVYIDDFYYPSPQGAIFDIVDLSSVEVLRGPQGTLFGRNTIGGAIRYTTKRPTLGAFAGEVNATYGSYDRTDVTGALNVPLGDLAALRFTLGHLERDGFVHVDSGGEDAGATESNLARVQFRLEPTDTLSFNLAALWSESNLDGLAYNIPGPINVQPATLPFLYNNFVAPLLGTPLYNNALTSHCFYCQPGASGPEFSDTDYLNFSSTISWDATPWLTVKSLSSWQNVHTQSAFDFDGTPAPIIYTGISGSSQSAWSQELQFAGATSDDKFTYVSGLFYYQDDLPRTETIRQGIALGGPAPQVILPQDRETKSYAAYADLSYKLTERLTVLGGYRLSRDDKDTTIALPGGNLHRSRRFDSDTWRVGAQYQWTDDVMTYVTVATGFRAGGFNPYSTAINDAPSFEPEQVKSYEAGARLRFFDHRLTINPTIFHYDWDKIQVQAVFFPPGSAVGVAVLQNAGTGEGDGFELEWSFNATPNFRLFGNLATLDLHYTDVGSAQGITVNSPLERAPELTWSAGASYTQGLGGAGELEASLNYNFEDQQNSTPTDNDTLVLGSYNLLNARLEWFEPNHRYSVALFGTNLTGEEYAVGGVNYSSSVGSLHYDLGRPTEYGVTVKAQF